MGQPMSLEITFSTDDPEHARALQDIVRRLAPFVVDNVTVHDVAEIRGEELRETAAPAPGSAAGWQLFKVDRHGVPVGESFSSAERRLVAELVENGHEGGSFG